MEFYYCNLVTWFHLWQTEAHLRSYSCLHPAVFVWYHYIKSIFKNCFQLFFLLGLCEYLIYCPAIFWTKTWGQCFYSKKQFCFNGSSSIFPVIFSGGCLDSVTICAALYCKCSPWAHESRILSVICCTNTALIKRPTGYQAF